MPITQSKATMKCTEQMVAHFKGKDAESNPVDPASVVWTSSDESVATLVPAGLDCHIIGGSPGECNVVGNGTSSGGKKGVIGVLALTVTVGEVASGEITTEKPVDQGTAPDQGLPSRPPRPGQGLPSGPAFPSQGLPSGGRPDQGLPSGGQKPDQGLPPGASPKR